METGNSTVRRKRSPLAPAIVLLCFFVAFAVLLTVVLRRKKADESQLVEARQLLQESVDDGSDDESLRRSRSVTLMLNEYIEAEGEQVETARLLLAAAMATEFMLDERAPASHNKRMTELVENAKLADRDTGDLLLAEQLFALALRLNLADKVIDELLKRQGDRADVLRRAIKVRQKVGRDRDVLENCDELIELSTEDPLPRQYQALVFEKFGFHEALIATYKEILRLSPDSADEIQPKLVHSLLAVGRIDEGREQFALYKRDFPNTATKQTLLAAEIQFLDGDDSALETIAKQRLTADPNDVTALLALAKLAISRQRDEEMTSLKQQLEFQVERDPNNIATQLELAQLCEQLGQMQDATTWRESAEQIKQSLSR
jgi:tetratricopeptide (TPR) repeat protein